MEYLEEALNSILNQTYSKLEIIAIDDGSSDGTLEFLTAKSEEDSRIRVIKNEKNLGLIGTLNKAISLASADYIARMDADDISILHRIETLVNFIQSSDADIVSCNFNYIDIKSKPLRSNSLRPISSDEITFSSFLFTPIGHPMLLGKKACFIDHPYSTEETSVHTEDYELWSRMIRAGVKFENHDEVLYSHRINPESVSFKYEPIQKKNFIINANKHYQLFFNETMDSEIYRVVVNRFESIDNSKIKKAIRVINKITVHFNTESESVNINSIGSTQKFDILFQAFKKGSFSTKLYSTILILLNFIKNSLKSFFWKYLKSKFRAQQNIFK